MTLAVLGIVTTLALCLIAIQAAVFRTAVKAAASAQMDIVSASTLSALRNDISELQTVVLILATSPFLADSNQRSETGGAVGLFKELDFLFKPIASVIAKGMAVETQMYELLRIADAGGVETAPLEMLKTAGGT